MNKIAGIILAVAVVSVPIASPAWAAGGAKFPLKGELKTFVKTVANCSVGETNVVPATSVGTGNVFVVTTACFYLNSSTSTLCQIGSGSPVFTDTGRKCQTFPDGIVIPEGSDLVCSNGLCENMSVSITGIITKKR